MPAGRVHALGPGILLAEIQQTSDITYRIYDWDRIDRSGMTRELHTEEALDAIDFKVYDNYRSEYKPVENETVNVVESPYFTTNMVHLTRSLKKNYSELDSFVIYVCAEGAYELNVNGSSYNAKMGEAMLLPAIMNEVEIHPRPHCRILEVYSI
jgi:mannose-6-phosphate isomerase